jgi:PAS domain S-box-containing protein
LRSLVTAYGITIAAVVAAVLLRWLLDPMLGDYLPLVTLFGAVAVAVWVGGYRPALLAVVLGYLACEYLFIEPRFTFGFASAQSLIGLGAYLFTCSVIIGFGEAMLVAQRRLAEQRERLRVTLASIGDAVITTDTECRITFLNAVAEALTGWSQSQAAAQPLDTVFHIVNEQTRKMVENPAKRALREGVIVGLANHTVLIGKDGTERPIDDSASPIYDGQGQVVGCVLVFRDITERWQAERDRADDAARVESVVNHVLDGIIAIDERGTVEAFNPAAEKLFGYNSEEVIGQNVKVLMPEPFHGEHDGYLANYRRTGQAKIIGIGREVVGRRKDGSTFPMDLAVSTFELDQQRHFTGIVRDISERKQAEEALKAADRHKNEFLATLAHELRNPLAPVRNSLQIMRLAGNDPATVEQALGTMERQVGQMARLVDDLLDVARISRGRIELRKQRVDLASVVYQAVEICRPLAERSHHEVSVTLPPESIYLHADPVRLAQVFSNLLNNACKYTEPGGRIGITAQRQGSDVLVSVKDTGIGIPTEMLARIFEIFTQVDQTLERSQGGLGIGLTLVKQLVEMHDGTVEAASEGSGLGSEFVVRLPIVVEKQDALHPATPSAGMQAVPGRRILVVDDNKDSAESLAILLKISGHVTRLAYDGLEAVAAAEEFRPEFVLLDLGLPRLNGFEACRRIREQANGQSIVLVALTGWGQEDDRQKSKDAGFDYHLVKPVEYDALMKLLGELRPAQV